MATEEDMSEPQHARPVFSSEDFGLIRVAIARHLDDVRDTPASIKYANLYHRLGRFGPARSE
jgi:hypothetical protein